MEIKYNFFKNNLKTNYDKGIYYHVLRRHNEVNRSNCFTKRDYRSWSMESNRYSIWSITYIFRVQI